MNIDLDKTTGTERVLIVGEPTKASDNLLHGQEDKLTDSMFSARGGLKTLDMENS